MAEQGGRPQSVRTGRAATGEWSERGLAGLVGSGPTRIGSLVASRVREVSRPTTAELAEAERTLVLRRSAPTS